MDYGSGSKMQLDLGLRMQPGHNGTGTGSECAGGENEDEDEDSAVELADFPRHRHVMGELEGGGEGEGCRSITSRMYAGSVASVPRSVSSMSGMRSIASKETLTVVAEDRDEHHEREDAMEEGTKASLRWGSLRLHRGRLVQQMRGASEGSVGISSANGYDSPRDL